jgi:AcrR family transcriptional regulator
VLCIERSVLVSTEPVKGRRRYDASRRREQAEASRRDVLAAAREMLLAQGYARTTVPAVAAAAGVSAEFIYKNLGPRSGLLASVLDVAVGGDDAPVALAERPALARLREAATAAEVIEGYVHVMVGVQVRVAPLLLVAAQSADPEAAGLLAKSDGERLAGMAGLAGHLHRLGGLRPELDVEQTRDVLWVYNSAELYDLLVVRRGWSLADYEVFVREALDAALLDIDRPLRR